MKKVVIIDYNMGNVSSVRNAFRQIGVDPELTGDHEAIASADRVILPGVGAFASAKVELEQRGLIEPITTFIRSGRPFLGICVGMQLLMQSSTEFGLTEGLGLIEGTVAEIPNTDATGNKHVVPHISWAPLHPPETAPDAWRGTPLKALQPGRSAVYFVHSFMVYPERVSDVIAIADYNGRAITAAVRRDNIIGVQFHPERSGPVGKKFLTAFLDE